MQVSLQNVRSLVRSAARDHLLPFATLVKPDYHAYWHHAMIAKHLEAVERGEITRLMISMPPRAGKQMAHDTPVITTNGWKRHGDLVRGDYVFSPSGQPIKVLREIPQDEPCSLRVIMSNGATFVVHPNHEWVVFDKRKGRTRRLATKHLIGNLWDERKGKRGHRGSRAVFRLPLIDPVQMPEQKLEMPPYVLGAWLGDGTSKNPRITFHPSDEQTIDRIKSYGYVESSRNIHKDTGIYTVGFGGGKNMPGRMTKELQALGVWKNKHIPERYMLGSIEQRLELLAGLIDTDGSVCAKTGRIAFSTTTISMAIAVREVCQSLGINAGITSAEPKTSTSGVVGRKVVYVVAFNSHLSIPTAIPRKRIDGKSKRNRISIVDIVPAPRVPGKCISVLGGVYLAGRECVPTHNSQLVTRSFPAWYLGRNPKREVIVAAYNAKVANKFCRDFRRICNTTEYRAIFPGTKLPTHKDHGWINQADAIEIVDHGGSLYTAGIDGTLTSLGADLAIIDDPVKNREEAYSPTYREHVWGFYVSTLRSRMQKKTSGIVVVMTRWHQDDLVGRLLRVAEDNPDADQWTVLNLPAIKEGPPDDIDPRNEGEALWPERHDVDSLRTTRATSGEAEWESLYQGRPTSLSGEIIQRNWLKTYREIPERFDMVVQAWDLNFGKEAKSAKSSYVAGQCWGKVGANCYLLESVRGKWTHTENKRQVNMMHARWAHVCKAVYIEDAASGAPLIDDLKPLVPGLIPVKPQGSKVARFESVAPLFEAGQIYIPEYQKSAIKEWVEEIVSFPGAPNDDQADACAMALSKLTKGVRDYKKFRGPSGGTRTPVRLG